MFTSTEESKFFTKSEYEHIGYDFKFEALAALTDAKFAEEIEVKIRFCYIKKFTYQDGGDHLFLNFYAEDYEKEDIVVINAYHNKNDYYSIDTISKRTLDILGIEICDKIENGK